MSFKPSLSIPKPTSGTRWVIADIHGCPNTLKHLVEEIVQLSTSDQLFLLGDYIDRGPDSGAVIDLILNWQESGYQIFTLRGNHEDMLLEAFEEYAPRLFKGLLRLQKCRGVIGEEGNIRPHYLDFMRTLPYYFELDDFYLVHGGFNFNLENPFEDFKNMLWLRAFEPNLELLNGKKIIHGHVPTPLLLIEAYISRQSTVIPLDNGCVYYPRKIKYPNKYIDMGNLIALNLDTWELKVTPNIDQFPISDKN